MHFHNHSNIFEDECILKYKENQNSKANKYLLDKYLNTNIDKTREISLEQPIINYKDGEGWGVEIDQDSKFRNARNLTRTGEIQQLEARSLLTTPKLI